MPSRRTLGAVALAVAAVVLAVLLPRLGESPDRTADGTVAEPPPAASTEPGTDPESGLPYVAASDLPPEARETLALIDTGGPFPYPDRDGATFGNFEGLLPEHERGYYAEYTVPTPGSRDRGARRIVVGDGGEEYWTEDHYASFARILRTGEDP